MAESEPFCSSARLAAVIDAGHAGRTLLVVAEQLADPVRAPVRPLALRARVAGRGGARIHGHTDAFAELACRAILAAGAAGRGGARLRRQAIRLVSRRCIAVVP